MPDIPVSPVLAHNVHRVLLAWNVGKMNNPMGNGFPDKVEGQHVVPLVQLGMDLCCSINNSLIVTKHVALVPDWDTKIP